jgi:hypothetical protein
MNYSGIYKFTEKTTGKVYVGQSSNVWQRMGTHYTKAFTLSYNNLSVID